VNQNQPWNERLGSLIRERRQLLQLTQNEVASLAGCSKLFIVQLEAGKRTIRLEKLMDVLTVLGLQIRLEEGNDGVTNDR